MSSRFARSSEVTTFFCCSHWFTPNCARRSFPFSTTNVWFELLLQLPLPLEREVRWGDDQDPLGEAAQLQLADQQPGHDRFPGAGVVGQQEPHAGELQQVVVDRLQLMRQRVDAGDRQPEIGIELPGDSERVGIQP